MVQMKFKITNQKENMLQVLIFILLMVFILISTSCSVTANSQKIITELVVGTGTDRGNEVSVFELKFDDAWHSSKGNMSCCWGRRGGSQYHSNVVAPKKLNVSWIDFEPERIFRAEITLSDKLYDYAKKLPTYYWVHDKEYETDIDPQLIVGVGISGEVVVWVSNSPYGGNHITGRVMYEVGRGQAICLPSINEGVPNNCQGLADEPKIKRPF